MYFFTNSLINFKGIRYVIDRKESTYIICVHKRRNKLNSTCWLSFTLDSLWYVKHLSVVYKWITITFLLHELFSYVPD